MRARIQQEMRNDCAFLRMTIAGLLNSSVQSNGQWLTGAAKMAVLQGTINNLTTQLNQIESMLKMNVVPSSYTSQTTKQTFKLSAEERRAEKLPAAKHSIFCIKYPRKLNPGAAQSRFKVYDSDAKHLLELFVEHRTDKKYPGGGQAGRVKKAYTAAGEQAPTYALKVYKQNQFLGDAVQELRMAMRGAVCNKLLGRMGYAFRQTDKQYLLVDWLQGQTLENVAINNIKTLFNMPMSKRLDLALMLVNELNILHQHGIIHCDIKPSNVMFTEDSLHIFDFDTARYEDEPKGMFSNFCTPPFVDAQNNWNLKNNPTALNLNVKSELYALGLTLTYLFPDVLLPSSEKITVNVNGGSGGTFNFDGINLKYGIRYQEHKNLGDFILSLVNGNPDKRPNSMQEVVNELSKISAHLNKDKLESKAITLDKIPKEKILSLPVPKRIQLASTLVAELAALHKKGIMHCDIKPDNVVFNDQALHMFDIESAQLEQKSDSGTTCRPKYTALYLDSQGNWDAIKDGPDFYKKLNVKSELFALGKTLASLFPEVILRQPNLGKRSVKIVDDGVARKNADGSEQMFEHDVIVLHYASEYKKHEPLCNLIVKLVSEDPKDRHASMDEVARELSKILESQYLDKPGKELFTDIETELMLFNIRNEQILLKLGS